MLGNPVGYGRVRLTGSEPSLLELLNNKAGPSLGTALVICKPQTGAAPEIGVITADMADEKLPGRAEFRYFMAIPTRWMDNDIYGHVNNVTYYSYFDTAVNHHLITAGGLDIHDGPAFGVVAETSCRFLKQLQFPDVVHAGVRVVRLGRSSVAYEIGLFRGDDEEPAALGTFVHVWVDRARRRPVPVPDKIRRALEPLVTRAS